MNTKDIIKVAKEAGDIIMDVYNRDISKIDIKQDGSPVTIADKLANDYICKQLNSLYPHIPIISEEIVNLDFNARKSWSECFVVDPLDGTKEFISRSGEFTVNIAYVKDGVPSEGIVYAPALNTFYYTENNKAYRLLDGVVESLPIKNSKKSFIVVASRSHSNESTKDYINNLSASHSNLELRSIGSSLKFCLVAQGDADIYPRLGPTMEWDTAAAHAVCITSGCEVVDIDLGSELVYNKENLLNPFFVVRRLNLK